MVDGGLAPPPPEGATPPTVKRKRGRPRKADVLAAQQAAAAAAGNFVPAVNGVAPVATPSPLGLVAAASPAVASAVKQEPRQRKARKKGGVDVSVDAVVDQALVGKTVTGVLDGSFDAGYLLSVRVGDSETVLRGVVFGPGLTVPPSKSNDVAPGVKVVKRDDSVPLPPATSPISVLGTPVAPNPSPAVDATGAFPPQATSVTPAPAIPATSPAKASPLGSTPAAAAAIATDPNSQAPYVQDSSAQPQPVVANIAGAP